MLWQGAGRVCRGPMALTSAALTGASNSRPCAVTQAIVPSHPAGATMYCPLYPWHPRSSLILIPFVPGQRLYFQALPTSLAKQVEQAAVGPDTSSVP